MLTLEAVCYMLHASLVRIASCLLSLHNTCNSQSCQQHIKKHFDTPRANITVTTLTPTLVSKTNKKNPQSDTATH